VSSSTSQLAPQSNANPANEPTYLLTSGDFETEFAAALVAEPVLGFANQQAVSTLVDGVAAPPVIASDMTHAVETVAGQLATPQLTSELADKPSGELVPRNIFSATLGVLVAPFRSSLARETMQMMPSWGGSMLVHMLAVLGLALFVHHETRSTRPVTLELTITEAPGAGEPEEFAQDLVQPTVTLLPVTIDTPLLTEPVVAFGEVLAAPELPLDILPEADEVKLDDLAANSLLSGKKGGSTEAKKNKNGKGTVELAENETSFFGVRGTAKKFCFVVDNSKSMSGVRFRTALAELMYSVDKLQADQQFYVVFFSDGAYPMFFPNITREMIPATMENKAKFREWLQHVDLGPATFGSAAMKIGLDLEPEVLYLLGDGDFQDDTVREALVRANAKTRVHAIGLDIPTRSRADAGFAAIARAFYGTYRNIRLTP
jgi:hypothetical protein